MTEELRIFLQLWAGVWFLVNKIGFAAKERAQLLAPARRRWDILAWAAYLVGLPGWLIIFVAETNWMVLLVEAAGIPAVILGLIGAVHGYDENRPWLRSLAYAGAALGITVSVVDRGIPTTLVQLMELGSVVGFVVGTCLLAKNHISGYFWYLLMNGSMGWLMFEQGYPLLGWQQTISLSFVLFALGSRLRRNTLAAPAPPFTTS